MIEKIIPAEVTAAVAYEDSDDTWLFPEEASLVARAVDKRRREFTTVRWCARRALADLGLPPVPIMRGEKGAPRWPDGIVGSMTHCDGYRAAAVARAADVTTIGIDAEPHGPLPEGILNVIALESELATLRELARMSLTVHWDRLLFCAKESIYKAWFPIARRWLGFEDAAVTIDPDGTFTAKILVKDAPFSEFHGRWTVDKRLAATAITVSA